MANFKVGDIVWLKSGSPSMTIGYVGVHGEADKVSCVWFDGNKKCEEDFHSSLLTDKNPHPPLMPLRS